MLAACWLLPILLLLVAACSRPAALAGTDLGGIPAPDFALADQDGQLVQLAALRGRPVVLTFLFTHCPDVCPLTASKLRRVADELGPTAGQVAFVAVTTDPEHDDAAAAKSFSQQHGLAGRLHFLLGSREELEPVWAAYYLYVAPASHGDGRAIPAGAHTDAIFVIDRQGRERRLLRSDFEPAALAATLRELLRE